MAFISYSNVLLPPAFTNRRPRIIGFSILCCPRLQLWTGLSANLQQQNLKKKNFFTLWVLHFPHFPHFQRKMMPHIVNILHLGRVFLEINSFHLLCTPPHFVLWVCLVQVALSNGRHLLFGVYWLNIRGQTSVQELASGSDSRLHGNYRINNQLRRFMTNPLKISFSVFI